jgi:DMSO/TMAO reductase YedYZ molybdopterin-dependent catalytic subunit
MRLAGPYAGNARWLGVPFAGLLREAGVQAGADQILSRSADGWTAGTPVETALGDGSVFGSASCSPLLLAALSCSVVLPVTCTNGMFTRVGEWW